MRVAIRLDTSNNEPRAVNDSASTVVGMPVTLNVLKNDADPDNDPLTVAGLPQLVSSTGNPNALDEITLLDDGEFFFLPTVAGDYVFLYAIIDGSERDAAYIRVRVDEPTENRPPTAIRDDVTISRGDTRNVYVLENDTDPDGDVIGIVDWSAGEGIEVEQVLGFAFRVTVLPDAPGPHPVHVHGLRRQERSRRPARSSSPSATPTPPTSHPSPAPTRSRSVPAGRPRPAVLVNDYDPEGGTLRVVGVSDVPGADLRIGPGGQEIYVSVDAATVSSFTFGYDVADEGGNQTRLARAGAARARSATSTARRSPGPTWPARCPARRSTSRCWRTTPIPTATRSRSRRSRPSRRSAPPRSARDGTIRYSPRLGESGSDRFRYTVVDANGDRAVGEVIIGVLPADGENRAPTATDDTYTVIAGGDIQLLDVLGNDSDPDGDPLSIADVDSGSDAVAIDRAGAISFEPPLALAGAGTTETVSFAYEVADGRGGTDRALVTVQIVESDVPHRADRGRRHRRPVLPRPGRDRERARQRLRSRRPRRRPHDHQRRSPAADRRRRHVERRRGRRHDPPRVHDHRRRRPDGDGTR